MSTYVDDMRAGFGRMIMCHMIADEDQELHDMAARIGVARKWFQHPGEPGRHYDICLSMRSKAVLHGAVEITWKQLACMCARRRETGVLGPPWEAIPWRQGKLE